MKHAYLFITITLCLSIMTIFTVSCEKPEPEPDPSTPSVEEQIITTTDRLVGKWALDWSYIPNNDTLLFSEEGKCYCIIGNSNSDGSSDTTTYFYDCSEQFLIFYNNDLDYSPQPHYIKFYDDYTYFVMYNCPFFSVSDMIWNAGFKKVARNAPPCPFSARQLGQTEGRCADFVAKCISGVTISPIFRYP